MNACSAGTASSTGGVGAAVLGRLARSRSATRSETERELCQAAVLAADKGIDPEARGNDAMNNETQTKITEYERLYLVALALQAGPKWSNSSTC